MKIKSKKVIYIAASLGGFIFVIDQAIKYYLREIHVLKEGVAEAVLPFLDLLLVWNRGVSYGLFQQESDLGQYALVAIKCIMVLWLLYWMVSTATRVQIYCLAMIIGGALGNIADNLIFGGVMDYVHFHIGTFSWYIFNFADVAIVLGVMGLFYAAIWGKAYYDEAESDSI